MSWWGTALGLAVLWAGAGALSGCAAFMADHMPKAAGGLPEGTPERPAESGAYPAVHDMPRPRTGAVLTGEEQKRLEDELVAARSRTATDATSPPAESAGTSRKP